MTPSKLSYLLSAAAVFLVLHYSLLPAVFSGLAVYVLTLKLVRYIPSNMNRFARQVALGVVAFCVVILMTSACTAAWSLLANSKSIPSLLAAIFDTLGILRQALPASISSAFPTTIEDLRQQITGIMGSHVQKISVVGMEGIKSFAHILLGMVVGGMAAVHHFQPHEDLSPFLHSLRRRLRNLVIAFDKVVFAQVKISCLNTAFTAAYLLVILPICGVHLPMAMGLVLLTFVVGLLPVVGNLVSNTVIVVISLGVSPGVGLASLLFLVLIHKAEYFMNARIVGNEVQATAWELLCTMLLMEVVFGVPGLVAAPVAYAWLKAEVKESGMI